MKDETLEKYIEAGKVTAAARDYGEKIAKPGMTLLELAEKVEAYIYEHDAQPAFPVNLSVNEYAAHSTPQHNEETKLKETDVLKIDVGAHVDGYVADTAVTVQFSHNSKLLDASRKALDAAIDLVRPGVKISAISEAIENEIRSHGFVPVENLTGHGLGHYIVHSEPQIPNVKHTSFKVLEEDQIIAIEPFASTGAGHVNDSNEVFIFALEAERPLRNPDAKKILSYARSLNGLPFAERWLMTKATPFGVPNSLFKVRLALRELLSTGALHSYPPLRDAKNGLISQAEHSLIVRDDPIIITK
jgi:methionyl aminopeptidase